MKGTTRLSLTRTLVGLKPHTCIKCYPSSMLEHLIPECMYATSGCKSPKTHRHTFTWPCGSKYTVPKFWNRVGVIIWLAKYFDNLNGMWFGQKSLTQRRCSELFYVEQDWDCIACGANNCGSGKYSSSWKVTKDVWRWLYRAVYDPRKHNCHSVSSVLCKQMWFDSFSDPLLKNGYFFLSKSLTSQP